MELFIEESMSQFNRTLKFSSVFDSDHMESRKNRLTEMIRWDDFVAPKYAVYVRVRGGFANPAVKVAWAAEMTSGEIDCFEEDYIDSAEKAYTQIAAHADSKK